MEIIYIAVYVAVRLATHREIEWMVVGAVAVIVIVFVFDYVLISVFEYAAKSGDEK